MAIDTRGNPIFQTDPATALTPLTLPTATTSTSLADLVSSIKAPVLPTVSNSSNSLALLLSALGSRAGTSGSTGGGTSSTAAGRSDWVKTIKSLAPKYGLDTRAVLAVAGVEGLGGGVGDSGTSFGPFQLHVGGALPKGKSRAWAESPAGIEYALQKIATVARGLTGQAAIKAIVTRFERPAAPGAEVSKAQSRY
jgi:hypothetical protein